jgi:hypothetical protein
LHSFPWITPYVRDRSETFEKRPLCPIPASAPLASGDMVCWGGRQIGPGGVKLSPCMALNKIEHFSKISLCLRFFQAQFAPGAVQTLTVSVRLSITIRISLKMLNASNEMGYIRTTTPCVTVTSIYHISFSKILAYFGNSFNTAANLKIYIQPFPFKKDPMKTGDLLFNKWNLSIDYLLPALVILSIGEKLHFF